MQPVQVLCPCEVRHERRGAANRPLCELGQPASAARTPMAQAKQETRCCSSPLAEAKDHGGRDAVVGRTQQSNRAEQG